MNIVRENTGQLEATIKVTLTEDDYREKVEKELKNAQKKMQMPGFRPGKVPLGLVKKMHGKSILVEQIDKIMADALIEYIKEENLDTLGSPIPDDSSLKDIDWENQKEFEFQYFIGLKPEIDLELTEDIEVDYHKIIVPEERVDHFIEDSRKRHGKMINPGIAEEDDVLSGVFVEVDDANNPVEGGKVNSTTVFPRFIKDQEVRSQFVGAKPGTEITMDVLKAVESETEAAAMTGIKKEELSQHSPLFRFTVESISRIEPAELNDEFFEKLAPGKEIKAEEELRNFVREQISMQLQNDVDMHFRNIASEKLIDITNLPLPEAFLKKWLLANNDEGLSEEKIDQDFEKAADGFRWQLIENHLIKKYNIEIKPEEVDKQLEYYIKAQLAQYGQQDIPQEILDRYVNELKNKNEEVKKVYDHLFERKLVSLLKEKTKLNEIDISLEDFSALIDNKYKPADESGDDDEKSATGGDADDNQDAKADAGEESDSIAGSDS